MRVKIPFTSHVTYKTLQAGDMGAVKALRDALVRCGMDVSRELVLNFINEIGWVQVAYAGDDLGPFSRTFKFQITDKPGQDKYGRKIVKK